MQEKKTLYEIVIEKLNGRWCDGLVMLDISDQNVTVDNIFFINGKEISINGYPISLHDRIFSRIMETDYENAMQEFKTNNCDIISPRVSTDAVITFEGHRGIHYGGNVYCHAQNGKIIVNDKHYFNNFDEIINAGFISKKETEGKWQVF